uniref:Transcription-repair-coupling factor n=1 Tax=uncultured Nocardioidaceae bacterium TaxID=253824 RepID=A0A6J4MBD7_9ACTN|nr:MAG: Transcription-repair coupling factor [uncultured Nocardioidaceae bacterium]
MDLAGLSTLITAEPTLAAALRDGAAGLRALDLTAPPSARAFLAAGLAGPPDSPVRTVLVVTATEREAEDLTTALADLVGASSVAHFPAWETLPHERLSPRSDTVGRRLAVLRRLVHPGATGTPQAPVRVLVAPVRSALQPQVRGLADLEPVELVPGIEVELDDVVRRLSDAAYTRVDLVEKRGEFAVRGGIVDVFPPTEEHPVRVEFWGDTVEEIRSFAVADQRSLEAVERLWAPPCRELLLTDDVRARAARLGAEHPEPAELFSKLAEGHAVEGMESLAPVLVDDAGGARGMEMLVDLLPTGSAVLVCDPERVRRRAHDLVATSQEFLHASWAAAASGAQAPIDLGAAAYRELADVRLATLGAGHLWWTTSPFGLDPDAGPAAPLRDSMGEIVSIDVDTDVGAVESRTLPIAAAPAYRGDTEEAVTDVRAWLAGGQRVVVVTPGPGQAQRTVEVLAEHDVPARRVEGVATAGGLGTDVVHVTCGQLSSGLVCEPVGLVVLTTDDLVGQRATGSRDERRMPSRRKKQVDPLELKPGDHVVHEQHGVGRYVEMVQRTVQGSTREYLLVEYASSKRGQPADRLFVPTDQLDQVTRYIGGEQPSLDRLGGGDWTRRKNRARKAVREIAGELIKLYAARQATKGYAYGADTPWQRELEEAFAFVETPDQLTTIEEVKADMRRSVPMDRLVCGDVGYGKTEIAVRAAFKAVQDGKQVAVLVPTTLLVQQHMATFAERFAQFPVVLKALSRFQGDKEAKAVIEGLAEGSVDVVIGTHRLLSPEVKVPKLGLVIVDEEQRFGVEHKEMLKHLRVGVDVLAMSATPIPRTLEMAVTGIREMSTITTPPEERHPVLSFVGSYDDAQVTAAIRRELLREGQVFYIHNRVQSINKAVERLRKLVPEARITAAHGQMAEHQLEQVMVDFWEKRYDVLVCTTIVESGLDVSNANTMVIERADLLGLSQLHQLRGPVGRGRERAYAYFLFPPEKPLTETAHDRLATIAQHSELGGGMAVAMKDLEIRGAGNLLGGEQSGHIADVGFDLYVRLVGEAVAEFRGDDTAVEAEVRLELPVDAHLPHSYVQSERLRLEMYKRLAAVRDEVEIAEVRTEMTDRYGEPPAPVLSLFEVARLRVRARAAGLTDITVAGNAVRFTPVELPESAQMRLQRLYPRTVIKTALRTILVPRPRTAAVGGQPLKDEALLGWCREVIDQVIDRQPVAVGTSA